jgi:hypothetical protein
MKLLMDGIGSTIPSWKIDVDPDLFWMRTGLIPILAFHPGQTRDGCCEFVICQAAFRRQSFPAPVSIAIRSLDSLASACNP